MSNEWSSLPAPPDRAPGFTGAAPVPAVERVPAPWALTGEGWVVFIRLSATAAARPGFQRPELRDHWRGGIGALTFMRYRTSGVGPYDEVLFIPGMAQVGGKWAFSICQIFVTTAESVVNGRANWGIPKDHADMRITHAATGEDTLEAGPDGNPFVRVVARPGGPYLPVNTAAFRLPMAQVWEGQVYRIGLAVKASVRWLDVVQLWGDGAHFPSFAGIRPIAGFKLDDFEITFPTAIVETL